MVLVKCGAWFLEVACFRTDGYIACVRTAIAAGSVRWWLWLEQGWLGCVVLVIGAG
jgi:hypothetical protein